MRVERPWPAGGDRRRCIAGLPAPESASWTRCGKSTKSSDLFQSKTITRIDLRRCLQRELEGVTGEFGPLDVLQGLEGVEVDVPGGGQQDGQQVAHGHRGQDGVGGRPHGGPGQDDDDDRVGDAGDRHEDRHQVAVDWLDQLEGTQPGGDVHQIAVSLHHTSGNVIIIIIIIIIIWDLYL